MRLAIWKLEKDWVDTLQARLGEQGVVVSRAQVRTWIKSGRVRWRGKSLRLQQPLVLGWAELDVPLAPSCGQPHWVWEGEGLLAAYKPAGLLTHPSADRQRTDLVSWARQSHPELVLLHRLDRETSGLILLAKTAELARHMGDDWAEGKVKKTYWAWVSGNPPQAGCVELPLEEVRGRVRPGAGGKPARTVFRKLKATRERACLELRPETGRKHQLRVHLASQGWPIVGDSLYGGVAAPRLALHAAGLAFRHPLSGREVELSCLPADEDEWSLLGGLGTGE